jgi:hypothetical protein
VLLLKNNWHIFENAVRNMLELVFFKTHGLEFDISLIRDLLQGTRLLKLIGAAHALQV